MSNRPFANVPRGFGRTRNADHTSPKPVAIDFHVPGPGLSFHDAMCQITAQ